MAGNVTGNIGGSNVLLENAATESTLQAILAAMQTGTKEQKQNIANIVQKAGLDPVKVQEANEGLSKLGQAATTAGGALGGISAAGTKLTSVFNIASSVVEGLTDNQGKASSVFGEFAKVGGVTGLVATGLQKIAQFQEQQLATYQQLTQNGISFGGSLTNMRLAASNMYLTMDEFAKLMKSNSETFARMGGTAEQGAQAFTKVSTEMMKGPLGRNLQALGYTAEQVNQGLATYIEMTGGRTSEEMRNTKALSQSAAEYLTQLDALAEITGKSKEEQIQAGKEAAANQAWQAKLMTMSEEERKKAELARAEALARGGKGAEQALMSAVLGFPPMTKAAREYTAVAGNMNEVTMKQARAVTDATKTTEDMKKIGTEYNQAAVKDKQRLGVAGDAIIMQGGTLATTMSNVYQTANRAVNQNADTNEKAAKQAAEIAARQKEREQSEAAAAVETQRAVMQMGQEILKILLPAFQALQPIVMKIVQGFADALKWINETPGALTALKLAVGALTAGFVAYKAAQGISAVKSVVGSLSGGGSKPGLPGTGGGPDAGPGKMIGGVADGLGKVGPMLSSLGKGAGELIQGIFRGIAGGLMAFANPAVVLGAAGFAAAIALVGAGIAGAAWIMGKALPTLAEGLESFTGLDGKQLGEVGMGMIQMGAGLAVFGAGGAIASAGSVLGGLADKIGSFFGAKSPIEKMKEFAALGPELGQAGTGLEKFNKNMNALLANDPEKIKNLAGNLTVLSKSLRELREAGRPADKSFLETATTLLKSTLTTENTKAPTTAGGQPTSGEAKPVTVADVKPVTPASNNPTEILRAEIQTLNKVAAELLKSMRETADATKSSANTLARNGNLFRRA
jgi:hypothetical protein